MAGGASDLHSVVLKKGDGNEGDASDGFRGLRAAGMRDGRARAASAGGAQ